MTPTTPAPEGEVLWTPPESMRTDSVLARYMDWLARTRGLRFESYHDLWDWSTTDLDAFWASLWEFLGIRSSAPYTRVLGRRTMPGAEWFPGARLNYAEHALVNAVPERPAILFRSERHALAAMSWSELERQVASVAASLRDLGVGRGDRVAAYLPNIPETVIAFLACASIGAIWSVCSPEFGTGIVIERFRQIEPRVLIAVDGYQYNGREQDRLGRLAEIRAALPRLEHTVLVSYLRGEPPAGAEDTLPWASLLERDEPLRFEQLPFDHPLWIVYSSGTTGPPKAIVHGHGGALLERLKAFHLHNDVQAGDRLFWFTTTGWIMWNGLVGGLLGGATIVLYDGSPGYPDLNALWDLAAESRMTVLGTSPGFLATCAREGIEPAASHDLSALRILGVTGSPLPPELYDWVYHKVKPEIWLVPLSGGTDVSSVWTTGCPLLPVRRGEMQCRALGARVEAWDEDGRPVAANEVGELVVTEPIPSMPLFFWNDPGDERYLSSYFEKFPGVWCHGDWLRITPSGGAVIEGRSDSTLNRLGVRMGPGDIYRVVEALPEIVDSLIVGVELPDGGYYMPLFVVLADGASLDTTLETQIRDRLRDQLSPRHVPDAVIPFPRLPRTLNGKKLEVPVKRILSGVDPRVAVNTDAISDPEVIPRFVALARRLRLRPHAARTAG